MTEAVGVYVGVWLPLPVCEAVDVCEGERPAGSERVALAVMVLLAVPLAVPVTVGEGVWEGVQRSSRL